MRLFKIFLSKETKEKRKEILDAAREQAKKILQGAVIERKTTLKKLKGKKRELSKLTKKTRKIKKILQEGKILEEKMREMEKQRKESEEVKNRLGKIARLIENGEVLDFLIGEEEKLKRWKEQLSPDGNNENNNRDFSSGLVIEERIAKEIGEVLKNMRKLREKLQPLSHWKTLTDLE